MIEKQSLVTDINIPQPIDRSKDDELIGFIIRSAWDIHRETLRYDDVRLVIELARKYTAKAGGNE